MNIPAELKSIPHWVLWRYESKTGSEKPTKVPYRPDGKRANITDKADVSTFEQVIAVAGQFSGIGFVFFRGSRVTGVDLDNPFQETVQGTLVTVTPDDEQTYAAACSVANSHITIIKHLNSYTELSPSGLGGHVFVFGELPAEWGKRKGKVEIYSEGRFFTVTGTPFPGIETSPRVEERQQELEDVATSLTLDKVNGHSVEFESRPETRSDAEVYNAICNSQVGSKFLSIYHGQYSESGLKSEARLELLNYISFFTDNKDQVERIFRLSPFFLSYTKIHHRDELIRKEINLSFDRKQPPIDLDNLRRTASAVQVLQDAAPMIAPEVSTPDQFPPGALGFIAHYIYSSAPYPVAEYALGGAIGLFAGVCGRAWNIEGAGLNQYVAIVGRSGSGKDAVQSGISRLLGEYETTIPAARKFLGARSIASAQALSKMFNPDKDNSPSQVSIIPEFGEWLAVHTDPRADGTKRALIADIMAIYSASSQGQEFGSMVYSDTDKNMKALKSPAFSFIGDTVANSFYEACTEAQMIKGIVPRMFVCELKGPRPPRNERAHLFKADPDWILRLGYIITEAMSLNQKNMVREVRMTDEARVIYNGFDRECEFAYHKNNDALGNIYSRAPLKAKKLAALSAVGNNWLSPCIEAWEMQWAVDFARRDVRNFATRISSGEIEMRGNSEHTAHSPEQVAIAHAYVKHISRPYGELPASLQRLIPEEAHKQGFVMASVLRNMIGQKPVFRRMNNNMSQKNALINNMLNKDMNNALRVGDVNTLGRPELVHALGMKPGVDYVIADNFDDVNEMAKSAGSE